MDAAVSAIVVEVVSTASLPRTDSFRDPLWTGLVLLGYALSFWLLAVVIRSIPVSLVYAIWSGSALLALRSWACCSSKSVSTWPKSQGSR